MRLSKQTSDAVKILVCCVRHQDGLIKVAEIAERTGVTKALGLKLVNLLSRLGYLETVRGPKGGIRLSCDPATSRLGDVVRDFEAFEMADDAPSAGDTSGLDLPPALEGRVDDAFEAFVTVLNQSTLQDLATVPHAPALVTPNARADKAIGGKRVKRQSTRVASSQGDLAP